MELHRILMIIPQNTSGGAERVLSLIANDFADRGIEVTLANFDSETSFYSISKKVNWIKMGLEFKQHKRIGKIIEAPVKEIKRFHYIRRLIKRDKPDIVLPFLEMAEILTIPNCILLKTPFCVSVRNDYKAYFWYMKLLSKLTYHKANVVVCQTKSVCETLIESVKCKTAVIPNPLDKSAYTAEKYIGNRRKVLINVGRLMPQKNQDLLIRAFSQIAAEFPDYDLHIFGKGDLREPLQNLIHELGLDNRVYLKGVVHNALAENRDASLFVMSSDFEGFPNTLVEAMANGIPVISTDFATRAARELLKNGECGTLVSVGDADELAKAMRNVLQNYDSALAKADKALYIRDMLDSKTICSQWLEIIEKTL